MVVLAGQGIFVGDSLSKRPLRNCRLFGVVAEVSCVSINWCDASIFLSEVSSASVRSASACPHSQ